MDSQAESPRAVRLADNDEIATSREEGKESSSDWEEAVGAVSADLDTATLPNKMPKDASSSDQNLRRVDSHRSR